MTDLQFIDTDAPEYANSPRPLLDAISKLQNKIRAVEQDIDYYVEYIARAEAS